MKVALLSLFLLSAHAAVTAEEVLNMTAGILIGACEQEHLPNLEACISDTGKIGYDLYNAVENFIVGDFEHVRQGLFLLGDALETLADDMSVCQDAKMVDIPKLIEMGQIFKNPGELVVQIGKDILVNKKSIQSDIQSGITDFNAGNYLVSGEDFGKAAALVLFGRNGIDVMPTDYSNAYLALEGYGQSFATCSYIQQTFYNSASIYGETLWAGLKKIFSEDRKVVSVHDGSFFLHQVAFVYRAAGIQMQEAGLFANEDLTIYTECIRTIKASQVNEQIIAYIQSAIDSFKGEQYQSTGIYLGTIAGRLCEVSTTQFI